MDRDVAEGAAGAYFDRVLSRCRALGSVQVVLHIAEARVEVQPGGDACADPDVDLAEGGLREDGTACDLAEADVAVGGLRSNRVARLIDNDLAIARVDPKVRRSVSPCRTCFRRRRRRSPVSSLRAPLSCAYGDVTPSSW